MWCGGHVIDIVPGDIVSSVILATAAAELTAPGALGGGGAPGGGDGPAVVHACTSTVNPLTVSELMNRGHDLWSVHRPSFQLPLTVLPILAPGYEPNRCVCRRVWG